MIHDISYKTSKGAKPFRVRLDEIDAFIKVHDGIRYLVLFDCGWFDKTCYMIKYLIREKSGITDSIILEGSELTHIILYLLKKY